MAERIYTVKGMTCGGCEASIVRALAKAGVTASADHAKGEVRVTGQADEAVVRQAVETAGFELVGPA